ncbi:MAG: hypothetical protein ACRC0W_00220 [Cetobacterium sp.]
MKKMLMVGLLVLSASVFANGNMMNGNNNNNSGNGKGWHHNSNCDAMMQNNNHRRNNNKKSGFKFKLNAEQRKEIDKIKIQIDEKKLELKKLMTEDSINWDKVGKVNQDISTVTANLKTKMMKYKYDARQEYLKALEAAKTTTTTNNN